MGCGAARWQSRDESSVYGVGVYGPLLSYESPCQVRELERGHPEEIKVAVHPDGQPVMTVFGIHHHPQSFLDELLSFSCLLAVPTSFLILCIWTSSVIGPDGRVGVWASLSVHKSSTRC